MFPATPCLRQEIKHLCLRRAALDRLINSLEEYCLFVRTEQEMPPTRGLIQPNRRVLARPVRSCQASKPISIGRMA